MPTPTLDTVQQCNETKEYLNQKTVVRVSFIGEDSAIATLAAAQKKGTQFSGLSSAVAHSNIDSSITKKIASDRTQWDVTYTIYSPTGPSGGDLYYTTQDSMTMVQYQFPLYKYLDADEAAAVASWENLSDDETDHKADFEYRMQDGSYEALSAVSEKAEKVAKKIFAGFEYVQKSYPQITHVERFDSKKTLATRRDKLNHIDDDGVPDLIDGYSWLKTQFDWQQNDDGTWTLTEAWIGVPEDDAWDEDLYGDDAWTFFKPDAPSNNNNPGQ